MTPEQTRREHARQRDAVRMSLLLAATPEERGEEFVPSGKRRPHPWAPHRFVFPVVNEDRPS